MKDLGVIGALTSAFSYVLSELFRMMSAFMTPLSYLGRLKVETLQEIALYVAIVSGLLTIAFHIGNMIIREEEFTKAIKSKIKRWFSRRRKHD